MAHRTAVVLFNLGGPDSLAAVRPFLYNLFSDPDIFRFPLGALTQKFFAWLIATRRTPEATKGYAALGGKSPLLENTQRQARALAQALALDGAFEIFVCMRYWHPRATEVVAELKRQGFERVVLLPLYPQYSLTTSGSSYNEFQRECERASYRPQIVFIRQWFEQPDYQRAIVESLRRAAAAFPDPDPAHIEVLFSAHGLPRKIVDRGDPYEQHIRATYDVLRARSSAGRVPRSATRAASARSNGCAPMPKMSSAKRPRPARNRCWCIPSPSFPITSRRFTNSA